MYNVKKGVNVCKFFKVCFFFLLGVDKVEIKKIEKNLKNIDNKKRL